MSDTHHIPIVVGPQTWHWSHNHVYAYVYDEEGDQLFAINTTKPTADLVLACIEAYRAGRALGRKEGHIEKGTEIRRALGITA